MQETAAIKGGENTRGGWKLGGKGFFWEEVVKAKEKIKGVGAL